MTSKLVGESITVLDDVPDIDLTLDADCSYENSDLEVIEPTNNMEHASHEGKEPTESNEYDVHKVKSEQADAAEATKANVSSEKVSAEVEEMVEEDESDTHPYQYLINTFEEPAELLSITPLVSSKTLQETPVHMVSTQQVLMGMIHSVRNAKEISLDYQLVSKGFTKEVCLLEISTKDADYVIDAISLQKELLLLTEIFINPNIVKIVYKAQVILADLQKCLSLYPVNIFDISKAMESHLGSSVNVDTLLENISCVRDSKYQGEDFRRRPLLAPVQDFCRSVPHYLIYIYHDYKNKLISKDLNLYKDLLKQFRDISKVVYINNDVSQIALDAMERELLNRQQCETDVLVKLLHWRDKIAKKLNKNPDAIFHKFRVLRLATNLSDNGSEIINIAKSMYVTRAVDRIIMLIQSSRKMFNVADDASGQEEKPQSLMKLKPYFGEVSAKGPTMSFQPGRFGQGNKMRKNINAKDGNLQNKKFNRYFNNSVGNSNRSKTVVTPRQSQKFNAPHRFKANSQNSANNRRFRPN